MKQQGAEVLTAGKLLGRERVPGERLTPDEVATLSDKVRENLVRQKVIALTNGKPSAKPEMSLFERAAEEALVGTRKALVAAEASVTEIRKKLTAAEAKARQAKEKRQPHVLAAAKGDAEAQVAVKKSIQQQRGAELEAEVIREALEKAEGVREDRCAAVKSAEHGRRVAQAGNLVAERLRKAAGIDKLLDQLTDLIGAYNALGARLGHLVMDRGNQLNSPWRLEARVAAATGLFVEPSKRDAAKSLAEIEKRLLNQTLAKFEGTMDGSCPPPVAH